MLWIPSGYFQGFFGGEIVIFLLDSYRMWDRKRKMEVKTKRASPEGAARSLSAIGLNILLK